MPTQSGTLTRVGESCPQPGKRKRMKTTTSHPFLERSITMPTPGTVGVDCPRCDEKIECTLHAEPIPPKPGAKVVNVRLTVPDLAEKMTAHYNERHALVDAVQAAVVDSVNVMGTALVGSSFEPIAASPIPDDEVARLVAGAVTKR